MRTASISRGGQVSIPADIRHRWGVSRVVLVDRGDAIELRPIPDDPIGAAMGSLGSPGPSVDEIRETLHAEELEVYRRRGWA